MADPYKKKLEHDRPQDLHFLCKLICWSLIYMLRPKNFNGYILTKVCSTKPSKKKYIGNRNNKKNKNERAEESEIHRSPKDPDVIFSPFFSNLLSISRSPDACAANAFSIADCE